MGRPSIFCPPFGAPMRWLGGTAVDRDRSSKPVLASAEVIQAADGPLQRVPPPEGTRGRTQHWKTGFCFIALPARVPIVMTTHAMA